MRLEGWNSIPDGYGARFDVAAAPWWLRTLVAVPFLDRFAYPLLVRGGFGYLVPQPPLARPAGAEDLARGWKLEDPDHRRPGSSGPLVDEAR